MANLYLTLLENWESRSRVSAIAPEGSICEFICDVPAVDAAVGGRASAGSADVRLLDAIRRQTERQFGSYCRIEPMSTPLSLTAPRRSYGGG